MSYRLAFTRKLQRLAPVIVIGLTACGPSAIRTAQPIPTQAPVPNTACERENTFELVPTRLQVQGTETGLFATTRTAQMRGLAVYQKGDEDPRELDELWPVIDEPDLQSSHQAWIQPVDDAHWRVIYWSLGGLGVMGAGLGTAAALQDVNPTGATVAGLTGLGLGLTAAIIAIASQPSAAEQMAANGRRYMFIPGEDERAAVIRGVDKLTRHAREQCH